MYLSSTNGPGRELGHEPDHGPRHGPSHGLGLFLPNSLETQRRTEANILSSPEKFS